MKVNVTRCEITDETSGLVATVQLVDEGVVQINIKQVVGWNDWLDLTDAVRKAMLMMEVKQ